MSNGFPWSGHGPGAPLSFTIQGHEIDVAPTDQTGITTGRRRFRVYCKTCKVEVHKATTGPQPMIERHIDPVRSAEDAEALEAALEQRKENDWRSLHVVATPLDAHQTYQIGLAWDYGQSNVGGVRMTSPLNTMHNVQKTGGAVIDDVVRGIENHTGISIGKKHAIVIPPAVLEAMIAEGRFRFREERPWSEDGEFAYNGVPIHVRAAHSIGAIVIDGPCPSGGGAMWIGKWPPAWAFSILVVRADRIAPPTERDRAAIAAVGVWR